MAYSQNKLTIPIKYNYHYRVTVREKRKKVSGNLTRKDKKKIYK